MIYGTGVLIGWLTMAAAHHFYKKKVGHVDWDWLWMAKISLLSWITVAMAIMLLKDFWHDKRNDEKFKNQLKSHTRKKQE